MSDNSALVTGASTGIGRAIALALAAKDVHLVITARDAGRLKKVVNEINTKGGNSRYQIADLQDPDQIQELVDDIKKNNRKLDLMVHSAGVAYVGSCAEMPTGRWQETLQVNLTTPFLLTQKCLPLMPPGSQIIFINSVAGKNYFPEWAAYCASKAGLRAYADVLRQEVQSKGIRVTTIFPSSVDTSMHDRLPYNWDRQKMLQSEDVARAVLYCYQQPASVVIKEIDLENSSGVF
jgi:NADP-dependent 3-hydroxy acid dehydrogenase YdfG